MIVVVHGPQGVGKTKNAEALRRHFGCRRVVDGWESGVLLRDGDLALTDERVELPGATVVSFEDAARVAGLL